MCHTIVSLMIKEPKRHITYTLLTVTGIIYPEIICVDMFTGHSKTCVGTTLHKNMRTYVWTYCAYMY